MLAGLLFANDDADDRPELLAATLRFGGATLIEFQARLLIAAGATQIIIAVTRATPELVGAVNRIARRGISVDTVRSPTEALEKVHPLATILVLADGLITADSVITRMIEGEGDALLVIDERDSLPDFERIDAATSWGGVARIGPRRLADAARLPDEYDFQSTLLRAIVQAKPARVPLAVGAARQSHGIERDSCRLAQRGRLALAARLAARRPWVDRFVLAPLARWLLPPLIERGLSAAALTVGGGVLALAGSALLVLRWPTAGLLLDLIAVIAFSLGQPLCWLRGEERQAKWQAGAVVAVVALATALLGWSISRDSATATGWLAAAALLVAGTLLERASSERMRRRWWASPPAGLLILVAATAAGHPLAGLIVAAGYAAASLAEAIERIRAEP